MFRSCLLMACLLSSPAWAGWQAIEKVDTYAIVGKTGPELYASIGERGPLLGKGRVIAHTNFKLTWQRNYQPQGDACVLVSARPKLIITYTLPRPSAPLPDAVRKNWEVFITGLAAHEKMHGGSIVDMVRKIEAVSVGLTVADDPSCRKIRTELTKRLAELSQAQRQAGRDFDRVEFGPGGNLQQLVLKLMTGG
jgi:predicted secreted Zn-dependent protease